MDTHAALAAYDILRFAPGHFQRLLAAEAGLLEKQGHGFEEGWLSSALEAMKSAVQAVDGVLASARSLPDLADVREDFVAELQDRWVDSVERLLAGVTFHVGSRAPILEALFPHQKFPALRKASPEAAAHWASEFERRLKSGYVTRMMAQPEFAFMPAVLEQVGAASREWRALLSPGPTVEATSETVRRALLELGARLDQLIQQTRLVAQAALLPFEGAFEKSGLASKPRRRSTLPASPMEEAFRAELSELEATTAVPVIPEPPPAEPEVAAPPPEPVQPGPAAAAQPLPEPAAPPKAKGRGKSSRERR